MALAVFALAPLLRPATSPARASAWNEPQGQGLIVTDVTFSGGTRYFDGEGKLSNAAAYSKRELFGYLEYGVTDWLMAVLKPDLMSTSIAIPSTSGTSGKAKYLGLGTSDAGAQVRVWSHESAVFSVQGSFGLPGTSAETNPALVGNTSRNAEFRSLFGIGFPLGPWPSFVDAQAAYRMRSGGAPAEWHADLTLGTRPTARLLLLLQSFTVIPQGAGSAWFPNSQYSKLGLSAVYALSAAWSVELGVFETVEGRDALRERGFKSAVWYRF